MINPNISKRVDVVVLKDLLKSDLYAKAVYNGILLEVSLRDKEVLKAGKRRLYLKYSILCNQYYLSDRG